MPASKYGSTVVVDASLTRPNDTTAYDDGDSISDSTTTPAPLAFAKAARGAGQGGIILSALLLDGANQSTPGAFELRIYDRPITAGNDNAAYAPSDADNAKLVALVMFDTAVVTNAGSGVDGNQAFGPVAVNAGFVSPDGNLYGQLVARSAYQPIEEETFLVRLAVLQD